MYMYIGSMALGGAAFGEGSGVIIITSLSCSGEERSLANCSYSAGMNACTHAQDAGVRCRRGICKLLNMRARILSAWHV